MGYGPQRLDTPPFNELVPGEAHANLHYKAAPLFATLRRGASQGGARAGKPSRDVAPAPVTPPSSRGEYPCPSEASVTDNDDRDGAICLSALQNIQNKVNPALRREIAEFLARSVGETAPPLELPTASEAVRTRLRDEGCAPLGRLLNERQCREVEDYFRGRPCFNTHVPIYSDQIPRSLADGRHAGHYGSYRWSDIARAPYLVETALRPDVLALASDYLGCLPTIYSIHAWWTFADKPTPAQTHRVHRDLDDFRFLAVFIYLTDVGPEDGPTQMIRRTHRQDLSDQYVERYNDQIAAGVDGAAAAVSPSLLFPPESGNARRLNLDFARLFPGLEEEFTGPAGTAVIADTFGLHHGTMPNKRDRLVCWIRYGLYRNEIYRNDRNVPLPWSTLGRTLARTPALDYMMRLLFEQADGEAPSDAVLPAE